jgi:hypothetical protein
MEDVASSLGDQDGPTSPTHVDGPLGFLSQLFGFPVIQVGRAVPYFPHHWAQVILPFGQAASAAVDAKIVDMSASIIAIFIEFLT